MRHWARWCLAIGGMRVSVSGLDQIQPGEAYVVVSNHQGQIDILILSCILPFPFVWVSKKELFRVPFLGWHMRRAGFVSVDRFNREKAIESMGVAAERLREGRSIVFFPEGTRSRDGKLQSFKSGAFYLAAEHGCRILPVVIRGSAHALPKGSIWVKPTSVQVEILSPIDAKAFGREKRDLLRETLHRLIGKRLEEGASERPFDAPG